MMKRILAVMLWLAVVGCFAQTANVTYNLSDFLTTPQAYSSVTVTPFSSGVNGNQLVTGQARTLTTDTNGSVTFSNMVMGYSYRVQARNYNYTLTSGWTNSFPATASGNINGKNYVYYSLIYPASAFAFTITNALATNGTVPSVSGGVIFVPTNYAVNGGNISGVFTGNLNGTASLANGLPNSFSIGNRQVSTFDGGSGLDFTQFPDGLDATLFTGNGSGLTAIVPANISSGTANINISGNAATANSFSGSLAGDVTGTQAATVLKNTGTAGSYAVTTFDAQGRETSGRALVSGDLPATIAANTTGSAAIATNATFAATATNTAKLFRIATTGGRTLDSTVGGGNTVVQIRYPVIAKDNLTGLIGVAMPNFQIGPGTETGIASPALVKAAIEYPTGTFWQLRFMTNGVNTNGVFATPEQTASNYLAQAANGLTFTNGVIANCSWTIAMTNLPITITNGSTLYVRMWYSNSAGIIYSSRDNGQPIQSEFGNGSVTDKTMGGLISSGNDAGAEYFPLAVFGYTANPSVAIFGDSIAHGLGENQPQDDRISSSSIGYSRLVEPKYACANLSSPGSSAQGIYITPNGQFTNRLQIVPYCSTVFLAMGHNDGTSCSNNIQNAALFIGQTYNRPVYSSTITPSTTSSDNFQTIAGQTLSAQSPAFTAFNAALRAGRILGVSGVVDAESCVTYATNSGYWLPGTNNLYTSDGTHPKFAAYYLMQNAITDFYNSARPSISVFGGSVAGALAVQGSLLVGGDVTGNSFSAKATNLQMQVYGHITNGVVTWTTTP